MSADPPQASFVLVPGAGGMAWYWHRCVELLERAGREVAAVDLPGDDQCLGLEDYAGIVAKAAADRENVILVAQSLAGFTAPLVCERAAIRMLVFVNAMIPRPGERARDWWGEHRRSPCARGRRGRRRLPHGVRRANVFPA